MSTKPKTTSTSNKAPVGEPDVLIIEPVVDMSDEKRPLKKFFANDIALTKLIYNSILCQIKIDNISINSNRKIVIVKFKSDVTNKLFFPGFLKLSNIGQWKVSCRLTRSLAVTYGVIGPFGEDVTDDLTLELREAGYSDVIATRIIKPKGRIKTSMFKVPLAVAQLPEYIYLLYRRYKVSLYMHKPWQCYNCQQFGHNADSCCSKLKCVVCAGHHSVKDCDSHIPRCSNCGNNHTANYGGCPFMKKAKIFERVRAEEKLSYRDACLRVNASYKVNPEARSQTLMEKSQTIYIVSDQSHTNNQPTKGIHSLKKSVADAAVQTEAIVPCNELSMMVILLWKVDQQILKNNFLGGMTAQSGAMMVILLWKVISIKDITDPAKQMVEIIKIIKITLDVQLDINYLESFLQTETPSTSSLVCTNVDATPTAPNVCSQPAQPVSNSLLQSHKILPSKKSIVKTNPIGSAPSLHKRVST